MLAHGRGDHARAAALLEESLALTRELGNAGAAGFCLGHLGLVAADQGDYARAKRLLAESLAICRRIGIKLGMAMGLVGLGALAARQGQPARAARLIAAAVGLREAIGAPLTPVERARHGLVRGQLDGAAWAAAWAEGRALPLEQAVDYALEEGAAGGPAAP